MQRLKFPWGELIILGATKDLSVGIDIIKPGAEADGKRTFLNKGLIIYYVFEGKGMLAGKLIKKGQVIKVKKGDGMHLLNNSKKKLKILCACSPPYDDKTVGQK